MPLDDTNWSPDTGIDATTELLIRARGFVERGWCRHAGARTRFGMPVDPKSIWAVSWCMSGALFAAAAYGNHAVYSFALRRLTAAVPNSLVSVFNDRQATVAPVLEAFDRCITAGKRR